MSARISYLLLPLAIGCGLPLPTDGATDCGRGVYIEKGATAYYDIPFTCEAALWWVNRAETVAGADMRDATIEFTDGDTLEQFGYPEAIGRTQPGTIAVSASHAAAIIHEAFHWRDGQSDHCGWSSPERLAIFDVTGDPGLFHDGCAQVTCQGHTFWTSAVGQQYSTDWSCAP